MPSLLVGYDKDWMTLSPHAIKYWVHLNLLINHFRHLGVSLVVRLLSLARDARDRVRGSTLDQEVLSQDPPERVTKLYVATLPVWRHLSWCHRNKCHSIA